ncbi:MAG: hypothetical protein J7J44_02580 [Deltaproteobacteria bacterium]|nr:hypothetical protein [Deltaproteobacteria bacterium]
MKEESKEFWKEVKKVVRKAKPHSMIIADEKNGAISVNDEIVYFRNKRIRRNEEMVSDRKIKQIVRFYNKLPEDLKDDFTRILPTIKKVDLHTLFRELIKSHFRHEKRYVR